MAAKEKCDPVFGNIIDGSSKTKQRPINQAEVSRRKVSFSVNTSGSANFSSRELKCYYCEKNHPVSFCDDFKRIGADQQFKFIRSKKLCDNCLSSFHFAAGCKKRKACTIPNCGITRKHLGAIHSALEAFEKKRVHNSSLREEGKPVQKSDEVNIRADRTSNSRNQFNGMLNNSGGKRDVQGLPNIPIRVRGKGGKSDVLTYALLDSGSTVSFCTNNLLKKLGVDGKPCRIQLTKIHGVHDNYETIVTSLEVTDLDQEVSIQ